MSPLDFDLRYWIARYLNGDVALSEFRRWLLPIVWAVGEPGAPDSRLVRRVELRLAEYMNGHWTEDDLRGLLAHLASPTGGVPAVATMTGTVAAGVESALATA